MSNEVSRRDFLYGAETVALAAMLNRAYAHVAPEDLAGDEEYWKKIRAAYARDPKLKVDAAPFRKRVEPM